MSITSDTTQAELADTAAPLDVLLTKAALGPVRQFSPDLSTVRWVTGLVARPTTTARRLRGLAAEGGRIAVGTSNLSPDRRDRRFADPAWTENPMLRRLTQLYLATGRTVEQLIDDADLGYRDERRVRFLVENIIEALSPSNLPLVNPTSAKVAIDTGGMSLVRGAGQLVKDLAAAPRIPEMVDTTGFEVGRNVAATPGAVVLRTEQFELLQFTPQTEQVYEVPLMIVPPTINKYYAIDLAPERSLVEYAVRQGRQVFVLSWRNPDGRHADWGFDTYVTAILAALDAVERISGAEQTMMSGICSGGILASITAAYLAAHGQQSRLAGLLLAVTVIDNAKAGTAASLGSRRLATLAKAKSRRQGYLDGRALAEVFAWLRPGDLVWNYWVNNYLLGKRPPAFDILFWNADTTRMSAQLHADFVDLSLDNALAHPGTLTVLDTPIDLSKIEVDSYILAGIADHITPWEACYKSTQLFGGNSRFVLSTAGHIAALVNPPGNPKSTYQVNKDTPADAHEWLHGAETHQGSWWADASQWLNDRCGALRPAPVRLGGAGQEPLAEAPGTYVYDS